MPTLAAWVLWVHIATGTLALLAGTGALVTTKGGVRHRQAGKAFLAGMGGVVGTVIVLLALDTTPFRVILTLVAVFSGYLAFSGYRALSRKQPTARAHPIDWTAAGVVIVACLGLGGWGLAWVLDGASFGLVMVVFGAIGLVFGSIDLRQFRGGTNGEWKVSHLQRMIGAYIATVSAVSAVNFTSVLGIVAWLWPTAIGVPLIYYWSSKFSTAS